MLAFICKGENYFSSDLTSLVKLVKVSDSCQDVYTILDTNVVGKFILTALKVVTKFRSGCAVKITERRHTCVSTVLDVSFA